MKFNKKNVEDWLNKGSSLGKLGKHEEAIKCYDKVLELNPEDISAWFYKGYELGKLGKHEEAIKCYDKVLELNPNNERAWVNKGYELGKLGKHEEAINCYGKAIEINPKYKGAWFYKGYELGNLGKYEEAIKCYERVLELNPEDIGAWFNKGCELAKLGKHEEAIKCYERVLELNPEDIGAWLNKGYELAKLGKHEEAINCYERVLELNPEDARAIGNIGITLSNLHKYEEAIKKLKEAKRIFEKENLKIDVIKVENLIELSNNAFELITKLEIFDHKFISSLNSKNFDELRKKSYELFNEINVLNKVFSKRRILLDVITLLKSKTICFKSLYSALIFEKVDLNKLQKTKEVFKKWNYITLTLAVNSLEFFIKSISKYKNLEEINKKEEKYFLDFLKASSYILDGDFTERIEEKFNIKTGFTILPAKKEYKKPDIEEIHLSRDINKNKVTFGLVQLDYNLEKLNKGFGYIIKESDRAKGKVFQVLELSEKKKVDIVIFPELCFDKKWIEEIKDCFKDMIIVGGSYYDNGFNTCPILINGELFEYKKFTPSPKFETQTSTFVEDGMKSGDKIYIFDTKYGRFSVLTCIDYSTNSKDICEVKDGVDFIINLCFDYNIYRFQHRCNSDCEDFDIFIIQVNRAAIHKNGKMLFGRTCIIGKEDEDILKSLKDNKIKPDDDIKFKLCEFNEESFIIIDINFKKKPTKPISIGYQGLLDIKEIFKYKDNKWKKFKKN